MNNKFTIEAILKASGADQFSKDFQNATKSMDGMERASKKSAGGLKSFIGGVGKIAGAIGVTKLVSAGFNAIRSSVDGAVSRVDTLNQFPRVLQQMGASGEDADRSIARLSDGIQGLPTTLDGVASTAQRMFTILGDIDLATESTLALNNAFLASGASQADASRGLEQYTQMLSAGKVDMQSWRTLQETMPYALKETAEAFGFTGQSATNDFYAALQSGEITMDEMNEKIIELSNETGGFAETALEASKGLATSWQNIKTAIVTGVANVIQAINEWMEDAGLGGIADNFDKVKVAVQGAFSYIVENIPTVLNGITGLFDTVKNSTAFQTLKEVIGDVIEIGKELIQQFLQSEAWANFKSLMGEIAQAVLDIDFREVITQVSEFLDKWSPLIIGIMGAIGAFKVLSTVIPIVVGVFKGFMILKTLISSVGLLTTGATLLAPVIGGLSLPILAVSAVIGALIAAGVLLWQNWDTVKEKASELGAKISEIWTGIKEWTSETWNTIWTTISEAVMNVWNSITEWFGGLPAWFSETWNSIVESVTIWASNMWTKAKETGANFINGIVTWFKQLPGRIQTWLSNTISRVTTWVSNMTSRAREAGSRFITNVINYIQRLPGRIQTWLTNTISRLTTWVSNMGSKGREAGTDLLNKTVNAVKRLPGRMAAAGGEVVRGFWRGITGLGGWIRRKVSSFFGGIVDGVKSKLKIFSPSRVFRDEVGKMIVQGFGQGIERNEKDAVRPMEHMLDSVMGVFDSQTSGLDATFNVAGEGNIANAMNRALDVDIPMVNGRVSHEMNNNLSTQPAYINVNIGGQNFRGFVENISNEQGKITDLELQF